MLENDPIFDVNLIPELTQAFRDNTGIREIDSQDEAGVGISMVGDGNCGYRASIRGLYGWTVEGVYQFGLTCEQQAAHMTDVCSCVTDFRSGLYIYLSQNINIIIRDYLIVDAAGDVLPIFQGTRREIMSRIGGIIWARGMDFDGGCHSDFWLDFPTVGPLLAHKYWRTFVSYSDGVQGNGVQNRSTIIAFYEEETSRVMMYYFLEVYLSQPSGAVCLSHSQNHFNFWGRDKLFIHCLQQ